MKNNLTTVAIVTGAISILGMSSIAGAHIEDDLKDTVEPGVVNAHRLGESEHCWLEFPPIDPRTLGTGNEKLIDPELEVYVQHYGPCDYDPLGEEAIERQEYDRRLRQEHS